MGLQLLAWQTMVYGQCEKLPMGAGEGRSSVDVLCIAGRMHAWHWRCTRLVGRDQAACKHLARPYCSVVAIQWYG
jgi:hypothetical protein